MKDAELRERFDEWAAPLRAAQPPAFGTIRRRSRARIGRLAAAVGSAAVVVALAIALAAGVVGSPQQSSPWGSGRYPAPPSQPYVYVSFSLGPTAQIRNAATGAVLATLRPPSLSTTFGVAAASSSDRVFVVAENPANDTVTFAAVRLLAAGHDGRPLVRMTQVPHIVLPAQSQVTDLVVNPAGTRMALESQALNGNITLLIYNLVTGSLIGRWAAGGTDLTAPLAFLPDGRLAIVWEENGPTASQTHVKTNGSAAIGSQTASTSDGPTSGPELVNRIINPAVPFRAGSSLNADSQPNWTLHRRIGTLTADGNMTISAAQVLSSTTQGTPGAPPSGVTSVAEYSSANGQLVRWIPVGPVSALNAQEYCGVLWASADGRDLLTQCGTRQEEVVDGNVTAVRLAWIFPTSGVSTVSPFAW